MSLYASSPALSNFSPLKGLRVSRATTVETAAESPYRVRVKSIGKRFNDIQTTIQVTQNINKSEQVEAKIRNIDGKITENHGLVEDKLRISENEIARLEEDLAAEIMSRELLEEALVKELNLVESSVALQIKNEKHHNKESEQRVLHKTEQKILSVRNNFSEERHKFEQIKEEQAQIISDQIADLQNSIKEEQAIREKTQETIITTFSNKLSDIKENLRRERKIRHETENFLFSKIEQINNNLHNQATIEREKREKTESQMLSLLEQACIRYEEQVISWRR